MYFVLYLFLLLVQIFPHNICFSNLSALFTCPKICNYLFVMILSWHLSNPAISITSSFDFLLVHDIFIILLMYHTSAASSQETMYKSMIMRVDVQILKKCDSYCKVAMIYNLIVNGFDVIRNNT